MVLYNWYFVILGNLQVRDNDTMTIVEKHDIANATLSRRILKLSQGNEESAYGKLFFLHHCLYSNPMPDSVQTNLRNDSCMNHFSDP